MSLGVVDVVRDERVNRALRVAGARIAFLCEEDGTVAWVATAVHRLLGYRPQDLVGTHFQDLYAEEDREYSERGFAAVRANRHLNPEAFGFLPRIARVRHASGHFVTVESYATPCLHDPDIDGVLMEWQLVTDRRLLRRAIDAVARNRPLAETQTAVVDLIESFVPGIEVEVLTCPDGAWAPAGPARRRNLDDLLPALPSGSHRPSTDAWVGLDDQPEAVRWAGTGRQIGMVPLHDTDDVLLGAMVIVAPRLDGVALMIRTVHDNLLTVAIRMLVLALAFDRSREEMAKAAHRDPLTNLLNRAGLDLHVTRLAAEAAGDLGVLVIDLDDFKPVNDTFGHAAGDEVLKQVARRLEQTVRGHDIVARTGGDEFVVICPMISDLGALAVVARRIRTVLSEPYPLSGATPRIGASLGGALGAPDELPGLFDRADQALYDVKRSGKSDFRCAAGPAPG